MSLVFKTTYIGANIPKRENIPYRKGVDAFIVDKHNNFLLVQKSCYGEGQWSTPGGGIDDGEDEEQALLRELEEELGTRKFEIMCRSPLLNKFEWPDATVVDYQKNRGKLFRGQEKVQFLVKFKGNKKDIKIQDRELRKLEWVPYRKLYRYLIFGGQWEHTKKTIATYIKAGFLKL